jgi:hypothetical protein
MSAAVVITRVDHTPGQLRALAVKSEEPSQTGDCWRSHWSRRGARCRASQAIVLSTIQRFGNTTNLPVSDRFTISTLIYSQARFRLRWNCGPW